MLCITKTRHSIAEFISLCLLHTNALKWATSICFVRNCKNSIHNVCVNLEYMTRLLKAITVLTESKNWKQVVISTSEDIGRTIINVSQSSHNVMSIIKVANVVRRKMFYNKYKFKGSLNNSKYTQLPPTLVTLIKMTINKCITNKHAYCNTAATSSHKFDSTDYI